MLRKIIFDYDTESQMYYNRDFVFLNKPKKNLNICRKNKTNSLFG